MHSISPRFDSPTTFAFGDILVDARALNVWRNNICCVLEPKALAVLLLLLQRPGEVVSKSQLLDAVWADRVVTPNVLSRVITQLRHALGDDAHQPKYIETVHTLGYRFIAPLQVRSDPVFEFARFVAKLDQDAEHRQVFLNELDCLVALMNSQAEKFPTVTYHLAILVALFGDDKAGLKLLEMAQEFGYTELLDFEQQQFWQRLSEHRKLNGRQQHAQ